MSDTGTLQRRPFTLLGGLSEEEFLSRHWQKRPLLVRQALPGFCCPVPAEELAGLACEEGVESRLVLRHGDDGPWELRCGPFTEEDFAALPPDGWSLLVQDVDKHDPRLDALLDTFRFVADWRIDDIMISYARDLGSVGPHLDDYDVFLLQGLGRRCWQVGAAPETRPALRADSELRLLERFEPAHEWLVEPGDLLYLPPGIAHHGVAVGSDCMTLSIGFRAPLWREALAALVDEVLADLHAEARYADPDMRPAVDPGEIGPDVVRRFRRAFRTMVEAADDSLPRWLGCYLTEPKSGLGSVAALPAYGPPSFEHLLSSGRPVWRNRAARFAYSRDAHGHTWLFVDGAAYPAPDQASSLARLLCSRRVLAAEPLRELCRSPAARGLLVQLVAAGHLLSEDE
jgi:50S ribosomal protein L16 3-hydroxylase